MKPVGILIAFAGYTIAYFGWCSLRGPGVGLVDLLVPGRDVQIPDGSSTGTAKSGAAAKSPGLIKGAGAGNVGAGNVGPRGASGAAGPAGPRG